MKNWWISVKPYFYLFLALFVAFTCFIMGMGAGLVFYFSHELPPLEELTGVDLLDSMNTGSRVYDKDGKFVYNFAVEKRSLVTLGEMPDYVINGMTAVEDQHFFSHWGVDLWGMVRAFGVDLMHMGFRQGASTITMQLARNMYFEAEQDERKFYQELNRTLKISDPSQRKARLEDSVKDLICSDEMNEYYQKAVEAESSFRCKSITRQTKSVLKRQHAIRKIKEVLLTVVIESHFSKHEILELYLNKVPFGPNIYGVEAAANRFFGKKTSQLTISEAALILGMPQSPSGYSPYVQPARTIKRRNNVLKLMMEQHVITLDQYAMALASPLGVVSYSGSAATAPDYFLEYVRRIMERKYGRKLYTSGMHIYTTIDPDLSRYAQEVLEKKLSDYEKKHKFKYQYAQFDPDSTDIDTPYLQGGALMIENDTGYVRVCIGGRNFNHSKYNRMTQAQRQPGSAFKPILYAAAVEKGYTPATVIKDEPVIFAYSNHEPWSVHNFNRNEHRGYTRMRDAVRLSQNVFAVKTIYDIGPATVADYARRFGLTTRMAAEYSMALGTMEVYPVELISAYTTFPNGGRRAKPIFVTKVTDKRGNVLESTSPDKVSVLSPGAAYMMCDLLRSVVDAGTGSGIRRKLDDGSGYIWAAAGKTGTTSGLKDNWFIGFNRRYTLGIWVGFDDPASTGATGGEAALPAWPYIMKKAIEEESTMGKDGKPVVDASRYTLPSPGGAINVAVNDQGKPTVGSGTTEMFLPGTEPGSSGEQFSGGKYNFYPTFYRENNTQGLVIDMDGALATNPSIIENAMRKEGISSALVLDHQTRKTTVYRLSTPAPAPAATTDDEEDGEEP